MQAERPPAFQAIIGGFVQLPTVIVDRLLDRHFRQIGEAVEAKLIEAGVADEEVTKKSEAMAGWRFALLDLPPGVLAGLDEWTSTMLGANRDTHCAIPDMRSRA